MQTVNVENYLCFYAILEMILSDIGIDTFSQYDLANEFSVVLPNGHNISNVHNVHFSEDIVIRALTLMQQELMPFLRNRIDLRVSYVEENPYSDYEYDQYDKFSSEGKL